jgi:hypothetical protein
MIPSFATDYAIIRQVGRLDEAEREAVSYGIITADELQRWGASLAQADRDGVCFASMTMVMLAGRKV